MNDGIIRSQQAISLMFGWKKEKKTAVHKFCDVTSSVIITKHPTVKLCIKFFEHPGVLKLVNQSLLPLNGHQPERSLHFDPFVLVCAAFDRPEQRSFMASKNLRPGRSVIPINSHKLVLTCYMFLFHCLVV